MSKVQGLEIPQTALLVTGDVTALYTNMEIERSLEAVKQIFLEFPSAKRPDQEILDLLEIALKNNDFEFAGRYFLQICGTAMGKRFAPALANIYLRNFDNRAQHSSIGHPENYFRFLDDIFFLWVGSVRELELFEQEMNTFIPGIKISLTHKHTNIEFLDTVIYKEYLNTGMARLHTKVFFKHTDTHQLLHGKSAHPRHTIQGILKSQLIRFKRICNNFLDYSEACTELYEVLRHRGYSRTLYRTLRHAVWRSDYSTNKQVQNTDMENTKVWPLINYYDPLSVKIAKQTREQVLTVPVVKRFRPINAYKIHNNLKKHLVHSRLTA